MNRERSSVGLEHRIVDPEVASSSLAVPASVRPSALKVAK